LSGAPRDGQGQRCDGLVATIRAGVSGYGKAVMLTQSTTTP